MVCVCLMINHLIVSLSLGESSAQEFSSSVRTFTLHSAQDLLLLHPIIQVGVMAVVTVNTSRFLLGARVLGLANSVLQGL